ncbi:MAG: cytochrome c [Blastocatellia bacterium]
MKRIVTIAVTLLLGAVAAALSTTEANNKPAKTVTFNKDIAPIFFKNCAQCHQKDDIAPFSVLSYKDVRPWAKSIREKVVAREMPPWHADPHYGQFANEMKLTQAEIDTIVAWVDGGAVEGNAKDLPPLPVGSDKWEIGKPDVILTMPEAYHLPEKGADDYIYIRVPTGFTEDKWIQASEFRPGNKRVVHHAVIFVETPMMYRMAQDQARKGGGNVSNPISLFQDDRSSTMFRDGTVNRTKPDAPVLNDACGANKNSGGGGTPLLSAYAPGRNADVYPTGTAKKIPAGSNLIFQMHYAKTTGKPESDRTSIAFVFAKQPVMKQIDTLLVVNQLFAVPAGAENHEANACMNVRRDVELVNYMPHMHVRGKAMKYEVIYPDGKRETLLNVDRYNFNWQTLYKLQAPLAVPKGSRLMITGWFDNSSKNKLNPDPSKTIRFGEPTYDEMLVGFFDVARPKPAERAITKLDNATLDQYVGEYTAMGMKFTVSRDGNILFFSIPGQPALPATAEAETKFYFPDVENSSVVFVKNERGEIVELQAELNGQKLKANRVVKAVESSSK